MGDSHEWAFLTRANYAAGAVTGAVGCLSCMFCWPFLFCLPLLWLGTNEAVNHLSDRKCLKCGMVITHAGVMKTRPTGVPRINPTTGQPNSQYGYGLTVRDLPFQRRPVWPPPSRCFQSRRARRGEVWRVGQDERSDAVCERALEGWHGSLEALTSKHLCTHSHSPIVAAVAMSCPPSVSSLSFGNTRLYRDAQIVSLCWTTPSKTTFIDP